MKRLEFLVEEKSMEELLKVFLPTILPSKWQLDVNYFIRSFEGKSDLQKSLPRKIKVYSKWHEPIGVVILQDQDSANCKLLKAQLKELVQENGDCKHLIRIICKELESWYIGDFEAVKLAYPSFKLNEFINKSKFRNPDICNASDELKRILPEFQKVSSAKKIAQHLSISRNRSESFKQFVSGINKFVNHV